METVKFRRIEKEQVRGRLPTKLEERIREEAYRQRTSISAVLTRYVARGMDLDPGDFGIKDPQPAA